MTGNRDPYRVVHVLRHQSDRVTECGIERLHGDAYPQPKSDGRYNWELPKWLRWCKRCLVRVLPGGVHRDR